MPGGRIVAGGGAVGPRTSGAPSGSSGGASVPAMAVSPPWKREGSAPCADPSQTVCVRCYAVGLNSSGIESGGKYLLKISWYVPSAIICASTALTASRNSGFEGENAKP